VDTLEWYTSRNPSTMVFQLAASGIVTLRVGCAPRSGRGEPFGEGREIVQEDSPYVEIDEDETLPIRSGPIE